MTIADEAGLAGSKSRRSRENRSSQGFVSAANTTGAIYFFSYPETTREQNFIITARIAGTFVGTIAVQIADPDVTDADSYWVTIASYTAPTSQLVTVSASCNLRIRCTAYTSGTAKVSLSSV
jgi:hypothetical protein